MKVKVKKTGLVLIIFVALAGLLFFVGRPVFIGYSTYQAVTAENYTIEEYNKIATESKTQIDNLTIELNLTNQKVIDGENQIKQLNQQIVDINKKMEDLKREQVLELQKASDEIALLNKNIKTKDTQISAIQNDYDALSENSAKSICCKIKLDDPDIDYYSIKNDKIVCGAEGKEKLKCSFS